MSIDLHTLNAALTEHVRPEAFPVAVRLVPPGEALPPKTKRVIRCTLRHWAGSAEDPPPAD